MSHAAIFPSYVIGAFEEELVKTRPAASQTIAGVYSRDALRTQVEDYYITKALGNLGLIRIREFQWYPEGWGDGKGRASSPSSFKRMIGFLKKFAFPAGQNLPSVFFTKEGGFELEWESNEGETVQVEFAPDRTEVFHEGKNVDEILAPLDFERLYRLLS